MNTSTAAAQAGVTVATIRHWARMGVIAATKTAGRWIISATSLARRIALGRKKAVAGKYRIEETQKTSPYAHENYTVYTVTFDGARSYQESTYRNRTDAEFHVEVAEGLPEGYSINFFNARRGKVWRVEGGHRDDPRPHKIDWEYGRELPAQNPCSSVAEHLIKQAHHHAEGAQARIDEHNARRAAQEAEEEMRRARQERLDSIARTKGQLATPNQVEYIETLVKEAHYELTDPPAGPTTQEEIEELSKREASRYIDALKHALK